MSPALPPLPLLDVSRFALTVNQNQIKNKTRKEINNKKNGNC